METREVSMRLLSDHEVYKLEMERIFAKTWLLLGHETEIPKSGDFVVRDMGEDQVIVSRDRKGEVHVLLNVCPHRGMRVCMAEVGQCARCIAASITAGRFARTEASSARRSSASRCTAISSPKEELGLKKARVQLYGGLIFATWNIEGPSLEEFLGDSKFYFDLLFCRTDGGLEVLGPPQKFIVPRQLEGRRRAVRLGRLPHAHAASLAHGDRAVRARHGGRYLRERTGDVRRRHQLPAGSFAALHPGRSDLHDVHDAWTSLKKLSPEERLEGLPPPGITKEMLPELKRHMSPEGSAHGEGPSAGGWHVPQRVGRSSSTRRAPTADTAARWRCTPTCRADRIMSSSRIGSSRRRARARQMKRDMMANAVRAGRYIGHDRAGRFGYLAAHEPQCARRDRPHADA